MTTAVLWAVSAAAAEGEENIGDVDPTNPVVFNVREEFYDLHGDDWRNVFILRTDLIRPGGIRGLILRFDVPFVSSGLERGTDHGLGDLFGQALLAVYRGERFILAAGSGLAAPTATEDSLGGGKWQAAPLIVPSWRIAEPRGLFFVKIQDYVSFAGQSDRADIHYMTVTPLLALKLGSRWWAAADTEVKVDWERGSRRSCKSGVYLLRMWTERFGTWVKPEVPWGENREGDWNVKASLFWTY